jgi:hypothetical protein
MLPEDEGMNPREIKSYYFSRFADGRAYVGLNFSDGTCHTINALNHADALLLLDVLRNEGPVYMDAHGTLYTGLEPVGEGEAAARGR